VLIEKKSIQYYSIQVNSIHLNWSWAQREDGHAIFVVVGVYQHINQIAVDLSDVCQNMCECV